MMISRQILVRVAQVTVALLVRVAQVTVAPCGNQYDDP